MESQRDEVTCQDLKTGSPDTAASPSHSLFFKTREGVWKGSPSTGNEQFVTAGKNTSCAMGVGEW